MNLLPLLRQSVSPRIRRYSELKIKDSATPASVYRLRLDYDGQADGPERLILKRIQAVYPDDPGFPDREISIYREILPSLGIRHARAHYTGIDPETQERLILLEDLANYRLPPPDRPWSQAEGECIARTYARLHVEAVRCLPPPGERDWLFPPHESRLDRENLLGMARELEGQIVWGPLPGLDRLLDQALVAAGTFAGVPRTLLHNDVYPPNVALPPNLKDEEAVLLDWEMASYGLPEMDLAFMFIQPFRAHRLLDKRRLLDAYWAAREALAGETPGRPDREARQFYADSLWGLWLVPVAYRMAVEPPPAGSEVAVYWEGMFRVLHEHLLGLSRALGL
ncbi:MAG TPA: phosphotransferase [Anaerolineales bacterium]|nr:phosphotransferase [Anaerolineales bacterium]